MRLATFRRKSPADAPREVGLVSDDGGSLQPLKLSPADARRGALALIEARGRGEAPPDATGEVVALADVVLDAPLPLPRRNLFCVGRNYRSHAKELQASVFKNNAPDPESWPIGDVGIAFIHTDRLRGHVFAKTGISEGETPGDVGKHGRNVQGGRAGDTGFPGLASDVDVHADAVA